MNRKLIKFTYAVELGIKEEKSVRLKEIINKVQSNWDIQY